MRDVAFNDSSPPASWHAEFVHMSMRRVRALAFVSKCVCMCRSVVDNVCLSAHSGRAEQNNPPENHPTLHQGYRLASTARYFSLRV